MASGKKVIFGIGCTRYPFKTCMVPSRGHVRLVPSPGPMALVWWSPLTCSSPGLPERAYVKIICLKLTATQGPQSQELLF